jgi:hypothetical protein
VNQSKLKFILEAAVSNHDGFAMWCAARVYIAGPPVGIPARLAQALGLTLLFTVVSLVRQ